MGDKLRALKLTDSRILSLSVSFGDSQLPPPFSHSYTWRPFCVGLGALPNWYFIAGVLRNTFLTFVMDSYCFISCPTMFPQCNTTLSLSRETTVQQKQDNKQTQQHLWYEKLLDFSRRWQDMHWLETKLYVYPETFAGANSIASEITYDHLIASCAQIIWNARSKWLWWTFYLFFVNNLKCIA